MNFNTLLAIVCAIGSVGLAVAAEDASEQHQKWMKDLGKQMGAMRKSVDVEKNAADMQVTLKDVGVWWKSRNSDVAMKTNHDSEVAAASIAKAAQSGDKEAMASGMKLLGAGCKGCHDAHREKVSENVYKIK